jgi:filamentous hemagglutinin
LGGITQEALDGNTATGPTITLTAGTPASATSPGYSGNIDLGQSGVIGGTVNLTANGNITGLIISRQNSTVNAAQNVGVSVISGGTADVSGGGSVSGVIVGAGGVSVSGGSVTATALGQNVSVNGGASQSTLGSSATATGAAQSAANQADAQAREQLANNDGNTEDPNKKQKPLPVIRRVKRVTVILPDQT